MSGKDSAYLQPLNIDSSTDLKLISGKKFTLVGTPEGAEIKDPSRVFQRHTRLRPDMVT